MAYLSLRESAAVCRLDLVRCGNYNIIASNVAKKKIGK